MKALVSSLGALAVVTHAGLALACGGFFCSQAPVVQTSEKIVFEIEGDLISAYIQIQFQGPDEDFAWVVPIPEVPEVEVGVGAQMFELLDEQTKPTFDGSPSASTALADFGGGCDGGFFDSRDPELLLSFVPPPDVEVLKQEVVGPYEVATITGERAADLNLWLQTHGYRVAPGSDEIVQSYLDAGMKLLALRLSPQAASGSIEPIKLTYRESRGCAVIPLRLTSIAALPNLEILTWVFGNARAVLEPGPFGEVEVDSNQLFAEADYLPALDRSVDAVGGRAFVTEFAQPSALVESGGDPVLDELLLRHAYVTRLRTRIDPTEMTHDPGFTSDPNRPDVSNVRQLRTVSGASLTPALFLALAGLLWRRR
ncbi:MAG: DUF2330 domain-containing protein [Deltaproteobacteria bacterium]|nr:DUF2330 domain-containing protein [Deltaproteobacteria bacterium]